MANTEQVTLHEGQEAWLVDALLRRLQQAGIAASREAIPDTGSLRVCVAQADVARAAAVLASLGDLGRPWSEGKALALAVLTLVPAALVAITAQVLAGKDVGSTLLAWLVLGFSAGGAVLKLTKPRVNVFGALSLLLLSVTAALASLIGYLNQVAPPFVRMLASTITVIIALTASGLTVAGFVSHLRWRGRYQHGLSNLVFSSVVLVLFTIGFITGLTQARAPSAPPFDATPLVNAAKNFKVTPVEPFRKIDLSKISPDATLAFASTGSPDDETYVVLVAEVVPDEFSPETLVELQKQRLEARGAVHFEGPFPGNVGGGAGLEARFTVKLGEHDLTYAMWAYSKNGYAYQWLAWGRAGAPVRERAAPLVQRFEVLDLEKRAPGFNAAQGGLAFESKDYGYSLALPSPWTRPDAKTAEQSAGAEVSAQCQGRAWFSVTPLPFGDHAVEDRLALTSLSHLFVNDPKEISSRQALKLEPPFRGERQVVRSDGRTFTDDLVLGDGLGFVIHEERTAEAVGCPSALDFVKLSPMPRASLAAAPRVGWLSWFYSDLADVAREQGEDELSLAYREELFVLQPTRAHGEELARESARLKATAPVLKFLQAQAGGEPTSLMHGARALVLQESGRKREAVAEFKAWFDAGFTSEVWLLQYVWALEGAGDRKGALAMVAGYRQRHDSEPALIIHAFLLQRAGQARAGLALLEAALEKEASADLVLSVMQLRGDLEQPEAALEALARWSDRGVQPTAALLVEKARAELSLKRVAAAKQSVDRALQLDPDNADARELFDSVKGWLGEGRNEALTEPIAAVPLPPELPAEVPLSDEASQPAFYELRATAVAFVPGTEQRETTYLRAKVNTREGVEMFSTLHFGLDPRREHLYLNSLVVTDARGQVVGTGTVSSMYLSDDASDERGTNRRTVYLPVPGLQPGATLEAVVTHALVDPPAELDFEVHHFSSTLPARRSVLSLCGKLEQVALRENHLGTEGRRQQPGGWWWMLSNPPRRKTEPFAPHIDEFLPTVTLGPSGDWSKLGIGYLGQVRTLIEPDGATTGRARQVIGKASSDPERIAALGRWVRDHVTYKAIEFGRGARIPRPALEVANRGYGDCKDQSLLLLKLLRAAGVEAELALVRSSGPIEKGVPSLDQFDHMVVWLPGPRFLDPTSQAPDVLRSAEYLAGQQALVLDGKPHFVEVPLPEPEHSLSVQRTVRLEGKDAVISEQVTAEGYLAESLRRQVIQAAPADRVEALMEWIGSRAKVVSFEQVGGKSAHDPVKLNVEYRVVNALREADGALIGELPTEWERRRASVGTEGTERLAPWRVRFPFKIDSTTRFVAPRGFQLTPPRAGQGKTSFASWALEVNPDATVHFSYERIPAEGAPGQFAAFIGAHDQLTEVLRQPLMLKRVARKE